MDKQLDDAKWILVSIVSTVKYKVTIYMTVLCIMTPVWLHLKVVYKSKFCSVDLNNRESKSNNLQLLTF